MTLTGIWEWAPGNYTWYEPPGQISTDDQGWLTASYLSISLQTVDGTDVSGGLSDIQPGDLVRMAQKDSATPYVIYEVTEAGSLESGYIFFPVTPIDGNGDPPPDGTLLDLVCPWTPPPPARNRISWTSVSITDRPNRFYLTCSCQHGSITELCATSGIEPVPPLQTIESTANNLLRMTACSCSGLVWGGSRAAVAGVAGL